jgi:hypothetical protein
MDRKTRAKFDEIVQEVADAGDVLVMEMWRLRDAGGWSKLGVNVVKALGNLLDEVGLGTLPVGAPMPLDQYGQVRIYRQRSAVGSLVEAVTAPSGKGDETLRRLTSDDADEVLDKIRELVCG